MGLCPTFEHAAIMKLLLFGYDASGKRHDGTWVTAPVKRGGSNGLAKERILWHDP